MSQGPLTPGSGLRYQPRILTLLDQNNNTHCDKDKVKYLYLRSLSICGSNIALRQRVCNR